MSSDRFPTLEYALVGARLAGRHGRGRRETLEMLVEEGFIDEAEMKQLEAAFSEGVEARRSGCPCHCISCHSFTPALGEKEVQHMRYASR